MRSLNRDWQMKPIYKRVLLKLSGEGLSGDDGSGINMSAVCKVAGEIAEINRLGVQVGVVVGGGNFFRGAKNVSKVMDRSQADQIGMLATVMNAVALKSVLQNSGCKAEVFSGLSIPQMCENYNFNKAYKALNDECVVIFAGGTGNPYFTTDTGAVLRAVEMHCDIMLKSTQVDGVYDSDPRINPQAKRFDEISFAEVLQKQLNVLDMTAAAMARDNNMPVMIFKQSTDNSIIEAVCGKVKCTVIK